MYGRIDFNKESVRITSHNKKCSDETFDWSPLPQRRILTTSISSDRIAKIIKSTKKLYPNCDANVWLRSCEQEIDVPITGKVQGRIPEWISGSLIRNGPGLLKVGTETFQHLFDCLALLHKFHIANGTVTYQCKFLQSDIYKRNKSANRIVTTDFGTQAVPDPCQTIFDRISTIFNAKPVSDNSMISVYPFGDELYAFGETPIIHRIDIESLETKERVDVSQHVGIVNHTSHPHVLEDGTIYNLAMSIGKLGQPYYNIVCFPKTVDEKVKFEKAYKVAEIPAQWRFHPSYMHTFGITDNYFIIVEQPLTISLKNMLSVKWNNEPLIGAFEWYSEYRVSF